MLTRIMTAIAVTLTLATAVASPALAQRAQQQNERSGGTYHGYPLSDWTRPDSW